MAKELIEIKEDGTHVLGAPVADKVEVKHMATPYTAELSDSSLDPDADAWVIDNEAGSVAEIQCPSDEQEATAKFIVKACNAHDAVVAALRGLLDCETNLNGCSGVKLLDAVDAARAALKLVE